MKIAQNLTYGDPSVISIADAPVPTVKPGEVLVKVKYSGVNRTDIGFLYGRPFVARFFTGLVRPRYPALGCEFSGTIEKIGEEVTRFKVGDRVFGFDDALFGGHAEYKTIREDKMIAHMPVGVSFADAGIATEGGHYAQGFMAKVAFKKGDHVFVHGATGGIGSAMVQLLVARGVKVTASSRKEHLTTIKKLGASEVVDWEKTPINTLTKQYDHFFDSVGKSSLGEAKNSIKPGGAYVSSELGKGGQNVWLSLINPLQRIVTKRNVRFPVPSNNKKLLEELAIRLASGEYVPLLDSEYALKDVRSAYVRVKTGEKIGNVRIKL